MPKLPQVTGPECERALARDGWYRAREGRHPTYKHPTKPGTVQVPMHGSKTIKAGTLRSILAQPGLSADEFRRLL
jgi:predicted RNA binding protein YcfA (HicA-like mRNA interferase family)